MRLLLFCLLLSVQLSAQSFLADSAFIRQIDLPSSEPFDTAHSWQRVKTRYVYICSDRDVYRLFGYNIAAAYHDFDFINTHIIGTMECRQCLNYCDHSESRNNCHRNKCNFSWVWLVRDNKKSFTELPVQVMPGHAGSGDKKQFFRDTVIADVQDSGMLRWYTFSSGDCHAKIRFKILADNYYPVLLQKELNTYGGCRAGRSWDFTLLLRNPGNARYFIKNKVLLD